MPEVISTNKRVLTESTEVTFNLNEALCKSIWVVTYLFILTNKHLLRAWSILIPVLGGGNTKEAGPSPPGLHL